MQEIDSQILKILACPMCKGSLKYEKRKQSLSCVKCGIAYLITDGIPVLMPPKSKE